MCSRDCPSGFSAKFTAEEVTEGIDGSGLTAIVTGATRGIGTETARVLALRGVNVIMGSGMLSLPKMSEKLSSNNTPLTKLISWDWISVLLYLSEISHQTTKPQAFHLTSSYKNYEQDGHFLLTNLLLENMKETAQESGKEGRIVIVSSEAHRFGRIRFDEINNRTGYWALVSYSQSKLANILHANELTRRLKKDGSNVTLNSVHPGIVATNFLPVNKVFAEICKLILGSVLKTVQRGAATTCYIALHPQMKGLSGEYFVDSNLSSASSQARDVDLGKKLWDFSMNLVNKDQHS